MDKINFYKKAVDNYFEKDKGNKLIYTSDLYNFGAFSMVGAIMSADDDISIEDMDTIYNYFNKRQVSAKTK